MNGWISLPWERRTPDPQRPEDRILSSVTDREADVLSALAKDKVVLEIGAAYGFSTVVLANAPAKRVVSVDPHTGHDSLHALEANLETFSVGDRVVVAPFRSDEYLSSLLPGSFDMAFVDGDHTLEFVRRDILAVKRLVRPGGVMAFHDYHEQSCPGVTAALDEAFPDGPDQLTDTLFIVRR